MSKIKLQAGLYEGKELGYSQYFGENPDWYKPFGMKGHNGIDIPTPVGTKLISCINGKVTETANDVKGYGIYVKIENDTCGVLYAHLRDFSLKVGDKVKAGDFVGYSGNTGNSTGPHLHFGVFPIPRDRNNGYAGYIDPFGTQVEWVKSLNNEVKPELSKPVEVVKEKVKEEIKQEIKEEVVEIKEKIKPVWDLTLLDGQKTNIIASLAIIISVLYTQGYIDEKLFTTIDLIITGLVGLTLRDAIKKK